MTPGIINPDSGVFIVIMAVCIKLVPRPHLAIELDPDTHRACSLGKMPFIVNPADLAALELAVRIKEQAGGEINILTVGCFVSADVFRPSDIPLATKGLRDSTGRLRPPDPLRRCLATGGDRVIVIGLNKLHRNKEISLRSNMKLSGCFRPKNIDSMLVARLLSQSIRRLNAEMVLCGDHSYDQGTGLVGPAIAELLDMALITAALSVSVQSHGKSLLVRRSLERGRRELVRCELPSVVTAVSGSLIPRYYTMPAIVTAFKKSLEVVDLTALGMSVKEMAEVRSTQLLGLYPPRPRTKKFFIPDSSLPPEARVRLAMSGEIGQPRRKGRVVEGSPEQEATEVIQFLQSRGILASE